MDKIETILLNYYQYEVTQVIAPHNSKPPTWWPHIVREYSPEKWATSPDPDSWPVDGVWELPKLGDIEVYNWVFNNIFCKLLTSEEKIFLHKILGRGYKISFYKACKIMHSSMSYVEHEYGRILLKIKNGLSRHEIDIYFSKCL